MVLQVSKTVLFWYSTAATLLLENTTARNTSSGYHPLSVTNRFSLKITLTKIIYIVLSCCSLVLTSLNPFNFSHRVLCHFSRRKQHYQHREDTLLSELSSNHEATQANKVWLLPVWGCWGENQCHRAVAKRPSGWASWDCRLWIHLTYHSGKGKHFLFSFYIH